LGKVQLEGKNKLDFEEFIKGYRKELDFSDKIL
jgi:hypothetical protein